MKKKKEKKCKKPTYVLLQIGLTQRCARWNTVNPRGTISLLARQRL